ncbi:MAG: sigma-54 dependent transcriptional regulator [Candidatus Latescibacterota bacterium]
MARLLIVDDNHTTAQTLAALAQRWGFQTKATFDGAQALSVLQAESVDVLVTDLRMPQLDGMELLRRVHERWPEVVVIVVTAYGSIQTAVEAMRNGAFDFLTKPYDDQELRAKIERAAAQREMALKLEHMSARVLSAEDDARQQLGMGEMIGASPGMRRIFEDILKVAPTDSTVLILGESGTGKELVARAIHAQGPRRERPFIAAHCAAYAEGLLESELFGHERGAFTGAVARKLGRLELAGGGTLFLDEIGDLSPAVQVKFLRVLQERQFERVGGTQTLTFGARVVAATNRNLTAAIQQGAFREDLYYRLNVFALVVPPLRERREDIPALVAAFCRRQAGRLNKPLTGVSPQALEAMLAYHWPGNVRELHNVVERGAILAEGGQIGLEHLPVSLGATRPEPVPLPEGEIDFDAELEAFERRLILHAYERTGHVKARTAKLLGIDRNRLRYKLEKFGIGD